MDRPFITENAQELRRLRALAGRLTDEELSLPMGTDWTISIALAHLAFWDQRALFLVRKWKSTGIESSPIDVDLTNESLLALWEAIPPRKAADLAISSAEAIDLELEAIPAELIFAIEGIGEKSKLYRSVHRKMHIDQIEEALQSKGNK